MTLLLTSGSPEVLGHFPEPLALLTEQELSRATAIPAGADRDSFVAAHILARVCVAHVSGADVDDVKIEQHCPRCDHPHGKPSVVGMPELAVSWSHSGSYVAALAGPGPLGVDIETTPSRHSDALARRVLTAAELRWMRASSDPHAAFLNLWVRKEALIKVGLLTLGTMSTADLTTTSVWADYRLTGWSIAPVIGACAVPATTQRIDIRHSPKAWKLRPLI